MEKKPVEGFRAARERLNQLLDLIEAGTDLGYSCNIEVDDGGHIAFMTLITDVPIKEFCK